MGLKINLKHLAGKKLLIAPLDWGLGHATRCIPVIHSLLTIGCDIYLAGEGSQEVLLRKEFPRLPFLPLKGYRVNYAASGITGKVFLQIPGILRTIKKEHEWLQEQVNTYGFEAVISDNRYGLCNKRIHSVFITHQLTIKSPLGKWSERLLQTWNYHFINRFDECWVPDEEGEKSLAGELSHPGTYPSVPVKYTGLLSRFEKKTGMEKKGHLLVLLSGPEPHRSLLENLLKEQIAGYAGTVSFVRGLPLETENPSSSSLAVFYNHLPAAQLQLEMEKAEYVISRSGYSTIMDLAVMKKKSILIPTPGQPEQEYLAKFLEHKHFALFIQQKDFLLLPAIEKARSFQYIFT